MEHTKKGIIKYIYLGFAVLLNAFIIMHSCLGAEASAKWSNAFVSFFANLFNHSVEVKEVLPTSVVMSLDKGYKYNYVPYYEADEIVLGKSKIIDIDFSPSNTSNKAIVISNSNKDILEVKQEGNEILLTGNKVGSSTIKITSQKDPAISYSKTFNVVEKKSPKEYTLSSIDVIEGEVFNLPIHIEDNDYLSYYDLTKLDLSYQEDDFSLYKPTMLQALKVGEHNLNIGDQSISIKVDSKEGVTYPDIVDITGKSLLASYQYSWYQISTSGNKNQFFFEVDNDQVTLEDNKVTAKKVDSDVIVALTARCYLDPEIKLSKEIVVKPTIPITNLELFVIEDEFYTTNSYYLANTKQELHIRVLDDTGTISYSGYTLSSSHEEVASLYHQGDTIYVECLSSGRSYIEVTSISNPSIKSYIDLEVMDDGAINNGNYKSFSEFIRKSIGHFLLFLASGVFTFLSCYYLLKEKSKLKLWQIVLIAALVGLFFAGLSEFIQYFIPSRFGSFIDVGVDYLGYMIGLGIVLLIIYLANRRKAKE